VIKEIEVVADTPFIPLILMEFRFQDGDQLIEFGICCHHEFWLNG
jgi:hypothetical protein